MRITWRERLVQQPALWAFEQWPAIPLDSLARNRRKAFLRNQQIVAQVLGAEALERVARRHHLSRGRISQLLDRCLGGEAEELPALTQGLIPYRTVVVKQRNQPLPRLRKGRGNACAFRALFQEVPGIGEALDAMIQARLKDAPYAQRLIPAAFYAEFQRLLAERHWPRNCYPYTTASGAYESVRRYLHQRTAELRQARLQGRPRPARNLGSPGRRYRALRAIQIDEHTVDLHNSVYLQLNDELIPLRVGRTSALVAVDVDTSCVLGYYLPPTRHPSQQDLLALLDDCLQPWQPMELTTPGLCYTPGARFPGGLDEAFPISFGTVQLDNALMHRAHSVIDLLCRQAGATLSYGPPAMPKIRRLVESVFDYINTKCSHRVDSTTGSHPADPARESRTNRKGVPVMTFHTLNEALSVILTHHNVTPSPELGNAAPLALFEHHCAAHFVRFIPPVLAKQWQPFIGTTERALHWYSHENRMPHVTLHHVRYQGPGLARIAGKERRIRVQFDRRDIRSLRAYSLAGEDLGLLQCSQSWQRFPHTLATRQWIYKNATRYRLNMRDPLASCFHHFLENKGTPQGALAVLRVYQEFTGGQVSRLVLGETDVPTEATSPLSKKVGHYAWSPDTANHRE